MDNHTAVVYFDSPPIKGNTYVLTDWYGDVRTAVFKGITNSQFDFGSLPSGKRVRFTEQVATFTDVDSGEIFTRVVKGKL